MMMKKERKMKKLHDSSKSGKRLRGEGNAAAWLSLVLFFALAFSILPAASVNISVPDTTGSGMEAGPPGLEQLPLSFIENQGQAPESVLYHVSAAGHTISFMPDRIVLRASQEENETVQSAVITMTFPGASTLPEVAGLDRRR